MTVGDTIRELRTGLGWSQAELADVLCEAAGRPTLTRADIGRWERNVRTPRPFWLRHLAEVLGVTVEDLSRRQFTATALTLPLIARNEPGRVGVSDAAEMQARFARLREMDSYLGGADTYRLYTAELEHVERLVARGTCNSATRSALTSLLSEQAQQAAWSAFDAGHTNRALRLYEYSHKAAVESGASDLAANALIQISYATAKPSALSAAEEGYASVGPGASARTLALLRSRAAWSYAVAGDARNAAASLAASYDALCSEGETPPPHWASWVDWTEVEIMTGRVWAVLHRPEQAIPALESALSTYPDHFARDKALYLTWLADAQTDTGNADEALSLADTALTLAERVASVRPLARIREVSRRLAGLGLLEGARLAERVREINPPVPAQL